MERVKKQIKIANNADSYNVIHMGNCSIYQSEICDCGELRKK